MIATLTTKPFQVVISALPGCLKSLWQVKGTFDNQGKSGLTFLESASCHHLDASAPSAKARFFLKEFSFTFGALKF